MDLHRELQRCDDELARIDSEDNSRTAAYLVVLGRFDWERERELIEEEGGRP